jgi:hypothetical protein
MVERLGQLVSLSGYLEQLVKLGDDIIAFFIAGSNSARLIYPRD